MTNFNSIISLLFRLVLSRKFCSAEYFGPGPIFSGKIVPPGSIFSEKNGPVLKILFRFTFSIVMNYNYYYDVKESAKKQIGSKQFSLIFNPTTDSDNSDAHVQ